VVNSLPVLAFLIPLAVCFIPVVERVVSPLLWLVIEGQCSAGLLDSTLLTLLSVFRSMEYTIIWSRSFRFVILVALELGETKCLPQCYQCP